MVRDYELRLVVRAVRARDEGISDASSADTVFSKIFDSNGEAQPLVPVCLLIFD